MDLAKGLVSVIMSCYNTNSNFLKESISSILNQTYKNFEFIIIDDGSTNNAVDVIKSFDDPRIKLIINEKNIGLTKSLNKALAIAKGEFVARMDSDDISEPERFEKQIEFLKNNSDVIVCGTWSKNFGMSEAENRFSYMPDKDEHRILLLFGNYPNIVHPSAMFNHSLLLKHNINYNENYIYAQDYRMWVECTKYYKCGILTETLIRMRDCNDRISVAKKNIQDDCVKEIIQEQLNELHLELTDDWHSIHLMFFLGRKQYNLQTYNWIKKLISANKKYGVYNQSIMKDLLWKKWAETTYFELYNKSKIETVKILLRLPLKYWPELINVRKERSNKRGVING